MANEVYYPKESNGHKCLFFLSRDQPYIYSPIQPYRRLMRLGSFDANQKRVALSFTQFRSFFLKKPLELNALSSSKFCD